MRVEAICRNCNFFDRFRMLDNLKPDLPREAIGTIKWASGVEEDLGFCRAPMGLSIGTRTESSACGSKTEKFSPKEGVVFEASKAPNTSAKPSVI